MKLFKKVRLLRWLSTHRAQVATGTGIAIGIAAGIRAAKKAPEALENIEKKKKELHKEELTITEKVEATWKCYLPSVIMYGVSTGLIIYGHGATARRAAAFATAYSISQQTLQEYKDAAKEIVGEKKAEEISDKATIRQMEKNPPVPNTVFVTGKGKQLCCDLISQHYFYSNAEEIRQAAEALNKQFGFAGVNLITLKEWYYQINCREGIDMEISDELSWIRDDGPIEVRFTCILGTGEFENIPILGVGFAKNPTVHEDNYWH